jgi:uncharacterized protein
MGWCTSPSWPIKFVKDPHEVVKAGDVVKVRVVEVDVPRKRIALSMRKDGGEAAPATRGSDRNVQRPGPAKMKAEPKGVSSQGALGAALAEALKRR